MHSEKLRSMPVSVGIPVYNEARYIEKTVLSAVGQADEVVICDNCSTDGSGEICEELARRHDNIVYWKNPSNVGVYENFKLCVERARHKYFLFLGGHDILDPEYIPSLKAALCEKGVVMAYGRALHFDNDHRLLDEYRFPFTDELEQEDKYVRLLSIITYLCNCTMVHGLVLRHAMAHAMRNTPACIGFDHVLLSEIVLLGKMRFMPQAVYFRREPHSGNAEEEMERRLEFLRMEKEDLTPLPYQRICEAQLRLLRPAGAAAMERARQVLLLRFGYRGP